jgi:hypothetical protein
VVAPTNAVAPISADRPGAAAAASSPNPASASSVTISRR